jgi:hypothetical protein
MENGISEVTMISVRRKNYFFRDSGHDLNPFGKSYSKQFAFVGITFVGITD